ncbi:MAG: hypothetical protein EXS05_02360 [Planctomycetaceae bacterium]|nr:hypothetical protein [Planctomycetaceae bacterium]
MQYDQPASDATHRKTCARLLALPVRPAAELALPARPAKHAVRRRHQFPDHLQTIDADGANEIPLTLKDAQTTWLGSIDWR